jgi:hypothetical protein
VLLLLLLLLLLLQDMYKGEPGSVLEFDMYHAEPLLPLSDEAIMQRMLQTYLVSTWLLCFGAGWGLCGCCVMVLLQLSDRPSCSACCGLTW